MKRRRIGIAASVLVLCSAGMFPAIVHAQQRQDQTGVDAQPQSDQTELNTPRRPDQTGPNAQTQSNQSGANAQPQADQSSISPNAVAALQQMAKSLQAGQYSFTAQTIRVYRDKDGQPQHIFHTMNILVRRPDRLAVRVSGDDGSRSLYYDGKSTALFQPEKNTYASVQSPDTIEGMMKEVFGKMDTDFPLADFLTNAPNKAFLAGVTEGRQEGTAMMVDGSRVRHFSFMQPPGIQLELWLDDNEQALPRRLIVTYHNLPDQPSFVALFSNWNFNVRPTEADFAFQPPPGATKVPFGSGYYGGQSQKGDK